MRVIALVSGGKDSCYNMMQCVAENHEIVALANLHPKDKDELDSYMYQTVGHQGIEFLAKAMNVPLFRRETKGKSNQIGKDYLPEEADEVEDLYNLLEWIKNEVNGDAVAVGAIMSDYQRVRVEHVCTRLNLVPLSYLWRRDQTELLQEMIDCQVHAIIIKVASLGLFPDRHLGKSLREMQPYLLKMRDKYGLNVCGEGGEYETFTLDCPLFKQKIAIDDMQIVISSSDPVCPVGYINFTKLRLLPKELCSINDVSIKKSYDYLRDLNESSYNDLSDPDLNESELELIEIENRMRESLSKDDVTLEVLSQNNSENQNSSQSTSPIKLLRKKDSIEEIVQFSQSPFHFEYEKMPLLNEPNAVSNSQGWMWIAGIQGYGENSRKGMETSMKQLNKLMSEKSYCLTDICYITMYVRCIAEYMTLNSVYSETINFQNPPTRVCVECPLPDNCHVLLEAVAFKPNTEVKCEKFDAASEIEHKRQTMHVQGISHWAPANIGPYSQSTKVGDITYISGQIALIPGSMTVIDGGIKTQCKLALRHVSRIAKAMNAYGQLRDVVQGICFVTHPNYITEARRQWERRTTNAIMDYIVVPALPRQALVEWQVWTHTHNDRFEYEETGCSISNFTISIRRRWNYENSCAAIVCYVSTGTATSTTKLTDLGKDAIRHHRQLAQSITAENFTNILQYTLNKLLKGYSFTKLSDDLESELSSIPGIHLKIFYEVNATISVELLIQALYEFKMKFLDYAHISFTVIPACSLQNFSTFLSICGVRHE